MENREMEMKWEQKELKRTLGEGDKQGGRQSQLHWETTSSVYLLGAPKFLGPLSAREIFATFFFSFFFSGKMEFEFCPSTTLVRTFLNVCLFSP